MALVLLCNGAYAADFCQDLMQSKEQHYRLRDRLAMTKEALLLKFLPKLYARAQAAIPAERVLAPSPHARHLIFLPGPHPTLLREYLAGDGPKTYQALEKQIQASTKILRRMLKVRDIAECRHLQKKHGFDLQSLQQLMTARARLPWPQQAQDLKVLEAQIAKARRKLTLPWQVVHYSNLSDIYRSLQDPHVADVIIVAHAQSSAHLHDSMGNIYPQTFFNQFSNSLRSLALYSCYSSEVATNYKILQSLGDERQLFTVREVSERFAGQTAPATGLKYFLRQVDLELQASSATSYPALPARQCQLRMPTPLLSSGTLSWSLNRQFLTSIDRFSVAPETVVNFPCDWAKEQGNLLIMANIHQHQAAREVNGMTGVNSAILFRDGDGREQVLPSATIYRQADGSIKNIMVKF